MIVLPLLATLACGRAAPAMPAPQDDPPAAGAPDAPQDPPQVEPAPPPPSDALEDLLRRLRAESGIPATDATGAEPAAGDEPLDPARLSAVLTRVSSSVQVVRADGLRRDLHWWDKFYALEAGEQVRQDGRGATLLDYEDGAHLRVDGEAVWWMGSDALARPREIVIERLGAFADLWLGRGGVDTVVALPGGNELAGNGSRVVVQDHDRRALEVRVTGPTPVVVRSPYLGGRLVTVAPGQRVLLPVLEEPAAFVAHLVREETLFDEMRGRLRVQAPEPVALAPGAADVALSGAGAIPGIARACGARVVVQPGRTIRLTRAPLGFPRRQEWDE